MKTKLLLSTLIAIFICNFSFSQTGGPDAFGYTWKNNTAAGGPVYTWKDIKGVGTAITGLGDDNQKGPFSMGWSFRYYWSDYNKIWVGSNGWMSFQNNSVLPAAPIPAIPAAGSPNNYLAPMSSDLTFTQTNSSAVPNASAWYWSNNTDTLIVQYDSVPYWVGTPTNPGYSGRYTFQVILSGVDSSITFQYKLTSAGTSAYGMANEGLTTGIENSTGQIGLQVLSNLFPTANTAVKFYYPNPVTYQVFDATPAWNQNTDDGGFFVSANGKPLKLKTDVANVGNQNLGTIHVNGQLQDASYTTVWTSSDSVTSLAIGIDSLITYPATYNATTPGTYIYKSTSVLSSDINSSNDITDAEMVVVDTTQSSIALSYYTTTSPTTQTAWGGNGGQGIYVEPPFYPAVISSLDFFVTGSGTVGYHQAQILDDNGPANSPGTQLYLDSIAAAATVPGILNNIPVTKKIVILSGGVYVAYLENGDSLSAIGTDGILPLSNRNYEIIGGSWSSYRNNAVDDIMISVNISKYWGTITSTTTADACPSNASGSATVTVTGGTTPYTYAWSTTPVQTTAIATGLAAGTYTVNILDSLGVATTANVTVYNNTVVTISTTSVTCFGGSNGSATGNMPSGTAPLTYLWNTSPVQTTATATGLSSGIYSVVVKDVTGCMNSISDTVNSATAIALSANAVYASCAGNDGSISSTVSGGTPAYTYAWSTAPVQTTASITGLAAGGYTLAVTDANGCTSSTTATVNQTVFSASTTKTNISCYNGSNGTATANSTGGTAAYTYIWTSNPVQTTQVATGLGAGIYTVTITDSKGCTSTSTATFTNPTQVNPVATATNASCTTCNNGTAHVTTTGGTGPYTYVWSTTPAQTTVTATGLLPGNYTVCATDSKGCSNCTVATVIDGTGVNELFHDASITISPNPFTTMANVNVELLNPSMGNLYFVIYDIYGREIKSIDLSNSASTGKFDFVLNRGYNINTGLYFYKLQDANHVLSAGKIIIQ